MAGLLWLISPLPDATGEFAVAVLVACAVLDGLGRPRPPAVRRQVPQLWGRLFDARTVAVLYGARLGVGPATILPTWLWWGGLVVGAACGPWVGAAAGAAFALARSMVTHASVAGVREGGAMSRRIAGVRRLERPVALAVVVLVAALLLAGCSGDGDGAGDGDAGPTRTSLDLVPDDDTVPPSTTTPTSTPETATLDDLLLDGTFAGFVRDDEAVGAGPMDLEAAARAEADVDAERALLETRGYVRGTSRAWVAPGDDVAYLAVYEFATPEGAAAYLVDGAEHLEARGAERFDVPGIEGAAGFTTTEPNFTAHAVTFTRGTRWFLVLLGSPEATRSRDEAIGLATRQAAALG